MRQVLETRGTDVNARAAGLAPLHLAAQYLAPVTVRELLNHFHIQVNAQTAREQQTALMVALSTEQEDCDGNRLEVIRTILEDERCHLDQQDSDGWIALTYSARTGNLDAGWLLLAEERSQIYTIEQLLNACRVAYLSGNEAFCDILMQSITDGQRSEIRKKIVNLKGKNKIFFSELDNEAFLSLQLNGRKLSHDAPVKKSDERCSGMVGTYQTCCGTSSFVGQSRSTSAGRKYRSTSS